jgi:hypothetical protein
MKKHPLEGASVQVCRLSHSSIVATRLIVTSTNRDRFTKTCHLSVLHLGDCINCADAYISTNDDNNSNENKSHLDASNALRC